MKKVYKTSMQSQVPIGAYENRILRLVSYQREVSCGVVPATGISSKVWQAARLSLIGSELQPGSSCNLLHHRLPFNYLVLQKGGTWPKT